MKMLCKIAGRFALPAARLRPGFVGSSRKGLLFSLLVASAALALPPVALGQTDQSTAINNAIKTAISGGTGEYVLPAGNVYIAKAIVVPAGTKNFTVRGNPDGTTIVPTVSSVSPMIKVGWVYNGPNGQPTYPVVQHTEGSKTLKLPANTTIAGAGWFILWDDFKIENASDTAATSQSNHYEIVRVISYNKWSGTVTLDVPVGRRYTVNPKLTYFHTKITQGIALKDFSITGKYNGSTWSVPDLVRADYVQGLTFEDIDVQQYAHAGIMAVTCRDITATRVSVHDSTSKQGGFGYGIYLQRCRFGLMVDCVTWNNRHGYVCHTGTMDVKFLSCSAIGSTENFDCHGFDERRISYDDCDGGGINFGNNAWLGGIDGGTVTNCSIGQLWLGPNAHDIQVNGGTYGTLWFEDEFSDIGEPSSGIPSDIVFQNATISSSKLLVDDSVVTGAVTFQNCVLDNQMWWNKCFEFKLIQGDWTFDGCQFTSANTLGQPLLTVGTAAGFTLTVRNCLFTSISGGDFGVEILPGFAASASFYDNTFVSLGGSSPTFLSNSSLSNIISSGNTASGN